METLKETKNSQLCICHTVAEMGDRLATTDMGRKVGDCCPLSVG